MVVETAHLELVLNLPKISRVHFRLLSRYMAVCNDHISAGYHHQYQRLRRKYDKNSLQGLKIIQISCFVTLFSQHHQIQNCFYWKLLSPFWLNP